MPDALSGVLALARHRTASPWATSPRRSPRSPAHPTPNTPSAKRAYDLRKLRGNQLVDKPARTRRHRVPAPAARTIAALLTVRDQVIAPILAGIRSPRMGRKPKAGTRSTAITNSSAAYRQTPLDDLALTTPAPLAG